MKGDREFTGTLLGFDDFVSELISLTPSILSNASILDMVLEDVTEQCALS